MDTFSLDEEEFCNTRYIRNQGYTIGLENDSPISGQIQDFMADSRGYKMFDAILCQDL